MATCDNISLTPQGVKVYTAIVCIELVANIREKKCSGMRSLQTGGALKGFIGRVDLSSALRKMIELKHKRQLDSQQVEHHKQEKGRPRFAHGSRR